MPKFLDVPTWYGSSSTTPLSLWTTSGKSGQLLKSNGSSSAPTWASFSRTNTYIDCAVFRAVFPVSTSTGSDNAEGFLYVNVPGGETGSVIAFWNFLDDNGYDGTYNGTAETTFCPAVGFGFDKYNNEGFVSAVMAIGIAKSGTSAGADPSFKVLRKRFNPLTGSQSQAGSASWGTDIAHLYTFDATEAPLFRTAQVVSRVSVS